MRSHRLQGVGGDAFALDLEDKFGCPLCAEGKKLRYPLFETDTKWVLKWPWRYYVARGHIYFERHIARYNRRAGTNYPL
jgi:hypothetical protein